MATRDVATAAPQTEGGPYWLAPGEGDARWVLDDRDTIKATVAQTGGLFALKEMESQSGSRPPPLHVHEREDEACYVIEGTVTLFVGDEVISATAGTWVYLPRRIPHSMRTDSDEARTLWLVVPGRFMSFFVDTFPAATDGSGPPVEPPDLEQVVAALARYGVTVIGPPPGMDSPKGGRSS